MKNMLEKRMKIAYRFNDKILLNQQSSILNEMGKYGTFEKIRYLITEVPRRFWTKMD